MELHSKLKYRIISHLSIELLEDLRVGGEESSFMPSGVDLPIVKNKNGSPYLPGSSLKGVIRSYIERIINSLDETSEVLKKYKITKSNIEENDFQNAYNTKGGELGQLENEFQNAGSINHVFGISGYAAPLKISDAYSDEKILVETRTHVSIDLNTGKAKKHALITLELIPKGYKFNTTMIFDELDDELLNGANALHLLILKMFNAGLEIHIGGWKSRGYGLSKISISKIEVYSPQKLILSEKPNIYEGKKIDTYIEERLNEYGGA